VVIQHHGILGMHWGVQRSKVSGYSKDPKYSELRDSLSKGSIVYRVSSTKREIDSGRTFIFSNKTDAENLGKKIKELDPRSKTFLLSMKVKKDLIGPSEKERVDTFLEEYKDMAVRNLVAVTRESAKSQGIDTTDKDGDETLSNYRAYTIAIAKNRSGYGSYVNQIDSEKNKFDMRRDDYMRGFTRLSRNDKTPVESLDSAYLIFSRSAALETISAEKIKRQKKVKHGQTDSDDLYAGGAFFNRRPD